MGERVLFLINGLGLGNSTRCLAVIERLAAAGAVVHVLTSDNGLWFLSGRADVASVTAMPSLRYGAEGGRISMIRTLAGTGTLIGAIRRSEAILARLLDDIAPSVVVSDSVYGLGPVRRAHIPWVALNNADMVVRAMARFRDWPAGVLGQFLCVELGDYLFHRTGPDLVISPRFDPADHAAGRRLTAVGPVVRRDCCRPQNAEPRTSPLKTSPLKVVIMLSGSAFGSQVSLKRSHPDIVIDIVGRDGENRPGQVFHGKVKDSLALVREADLMIVNGGFSAVAEAFMLKKPMVVVPVPRHAEQWANARIIRHLGVGLISREDGIETSMEEALASISALRAAYGRLPSPPDGAGQAASAILACARGQQG